MQTDEFISSIFQSKDEELDKLREGLPLGQDLAGNVTLARKTQRLLAYRFTCVTGEARSEYIRRLILSLACLYDKYEACFLVLSPRREYGELLQFRYMDVTVPYVREKQDLENARKTLKELLQMRSVGRGYPKLFLVLDGLEELPDCNADGEFEEYRSFFDLIARRMDVDVIGGVDLQKSIYSGLPGVFIGVGNCLVNVREDGKADVSYVNDSATLSESISVRIPDSPEIGQTIEYLNKSGPKD